MKHVSVPVAMAVLYQNRHFLMQLRDDRQDILYPGKWGLFGGHLESGELPQRGLIREIQEEINYTIANPTLFRCYQDSRASRYIFFAHLSVTMASLSLNEGWDLDLVPIENIRLGYHYSKQAGETRYLGDIHQKILLDFATFANENIPDFQ